MESYENCHYASVYLYKRPFEGTKVFNNIKNLFCYVTHYCNLVAEFNGLVSKKRSVFLPAFFIL